MDGFEALLAMNSLPHTHIRTPFWIIFHIIIIFLYQSSLFLLPYICERWPRPQIATTSVCGKVSSYTLLLYLHTVHWFMTVVFDRIYYYHHRRHRILGYLKFYRNTRIFRRFPLHTVSLISAILCAVIQLTSTLCTVRKNDQSPDWLNNKICFSIHIHKNQNVQISQLVVLQFIVTLENILLLYNLIIYFRRTLDMNQSNIRPDAYTDENAPPHIHINEREIYDDDQSLLLVDENQSECEKLTKKISYWKQLAFDQSERTIFLLQRNEYLAKRVLELNTFIISN
ncbi:hypothetical protein SNEBB_001444 [Seison nebaliae]|nr:hypothetical protein SNEBB_001444 [Seison nebaliae]